MKKTGLVLVCVLLLSVTAYAQVNVVVAGDSIDIDTAGLPPRMQKAYALMQQKCTRCHTLERIIVAVRTGVAPITNTPFTKDTTQGIVIRMYLKEGSDIARSDARTIILFLNYLLDQGVLIRAGNGGDMNAVQENGMKRYSSPLLR